MLAASSLQVAGLSRCTLPLTAAGQVNLVVTELGVIDITTEVMELIEIAPSASIEYVKQRTEAKLHVSPQLKAMPLPTEMSSIY